MRSCSVPTCGEILGAFVFTCPVCEKHVCGDHIENVMDPFLLGDEAADFDPIQICVVCYVHNTDALNTVRDRLAKIAAGPLRDHIVAQLKLANVGRELKNG